MRCTVCSCTGQVQLPPRPLEYAPLDQSNIFGQPVASRIVWSLWRNEKLYLRDHEYTKIGQHHTKLVTPSLGLVKMQVRGDLKIMKIRRALAVIWLSYLLQRIIPISVSDSLSFACRKTW